MTMMGESLKAKEIAPATLLLEQITGVEEKYRDCLVRVDKIRGVVCGPAHAPPEKMSVSPAPEGLIGELLGCVGRLIHIENEISEDLATIERTLGMR